MTQVLERHLLENAQRRRDRGEDPRYFRIHDSGDFHSPDYLDAWAQIARNMPSVRFWAPTRVWNVPGFKGALTRALAVDNLRIRPSAMNFSDPPPALDFLSAAGSSAAAVAVDTEGRAVWQCPALAADGHACGNARAPDCTTECRVCWGGRVDRVEDFRQVPVTYAKH